MFQLNEIDLSQFPPLLQFGLLFLMLVYGIWQARGAVQNLKTGNKTIKAQTSEDTQGTLVTLLADQVNLRQELMIKLRKAEQQRDDCLGKLEDCHETPKP